MTKATNPTFVANETAAAEHAFSGARSRPVMAMNGDKMVVCCKTTAKKHGWSIIGRMYPRVRG